MLFSQFASGRSYGLGESILRELTTRFCRGNIKWYCSNSKRRFLAQTRKGPFCEIQWYYHEGGILTIKQRSRKPVSSYRISAEGVRQLKDLAQSMERSESNVIEIALDRMYREEIRFGYQLSEKNGSYQAASITDE